METTHKVAEKSSTAHDRFRPSWGTSDCFREIQYNHLQIDLVFTRDSRVKKSFSCSTLPVPNCHATRRLHEGSDTARLPRPRQGKSRGRGRVRTTDLQVSKFALQPLRPSRPPHSGV
ncbi:hypothetical protein T265_00576 [Opisthorchis viverrini]|uniref:Uncharacterized protein n=1 Tax=Opisthorchis viverrini TaxID=6198 RepID=A0A075A5Y2_OPIVI|nr:hypothetical protein T265_00576 [Opisthorchis viverrini]KER33697.1 hypothetical protein T265_00576 [Opisthorchis viverrini]